LVDVIHALQFLDYYPVLLDDFLPRDSWWKEIFSYAKAAEVSGGEKLGLNWTHITYSLYGSVSLYASEISC